MWLCMMMGKQDFASLYLSFQSGSHLSLLHAIVSWHPQDQWTYYSISFWGPQSTSSNALYYSTSFGLESATRPFMESQMQSSIKQMDQIHSVLPYLALSEPLPGAVLNFSQGIQNSSGLSRGACPLNKRQQMKNCAARICLRYREPATFLILLASPITLKQHGQ